MANVFGGRSMVAFAAAGVLLFGAGCGDSFTATTGTGAGASTNAGGGGATGGGGAGGSTTTTMAECSMGQTRPCYTGKPIDSAKKGLCHPGTEGCVNGKWSGKCENEVTPQTEACDGKDNDCDGTVDNGCTCMTGKTQYCYDGPDGTDKHMPCHGGQQTCSQDGTWGACMMEKKPDVNSESCPPNQIDDDCNGNVDDIPNLGIQCDTGLQGVCAPGMFQCNGSDLICHQNTQKSAEVCDKADNDCNGAVDDFPGFCDYPIAQVGKACTGNLHCTANGGQMPACLPPPPVFFASFSAGDGWSTSGEWSIGPAMMGGGGMGNPDPGMDHTGGNVDNKLAGIVIGGDTGAFPHGPDYLVSPKIDASKLPAGSSLYLGFFRWLNVEGNATMSATVDVSTDDGQSWTNIWKNQDPNGIYDDGWTLQPYDITPYKSDKLRIRFGWSVLIALPQESSSGWNIDDVVVGACPNAG